ncbi:MAG: hypothetical protein HY802_02975 [Methanobacterium sp.]|nr:hypothetical protein [Methanobacterium sp.]
MEKNRNLKFISLVMGIGIIFLFLAAFFRSNSQLDLLFITMGIAVIVNGVYAQNEKFTGKIIYFMFGINLFQWLLLINIIFINQIQLTVYTLFPLAIAPVITLYLISQIYKNDLNYPRKNQNKDILLADKMKGISISAGFAAMIIGLTGYAFSISPIYLYGSSIGVMAIVYGYHRENKKLKLTLNYFVTMSFLILIQWLIIIFLLRPVSALNEIQYNLSFTFSLLLTSFYFDQIRNSHLIKINWQGIFIGNKKIF